MCGITCLRDLITRKKVNKTPTSPPSPFIPPRNISKMMSPNPRRSPRQQSSTSTRRSIGGAGTSLATGLMPGTPSRRGENIPLQPSPLRNEISASASKAKSRKRARSLGGNGGDDPLAPSSAKQINPRKKRMTIVRTRGDDADVGPCERDIEEGRGGNVYWRTYGYWSNSTSVERGESEGGGN